MAWDSPLAALEQVVTACADLGLEGAGDRVTDDGGVRLDRLVVEMPLELQTRTSARGEVTVETSPPRQALVTSVMPVLHRIRLTVEGER